MFLGVTIPTNSHKLAMLLDRSVSGQKCPKLAVSSPWCYGFEGPLSRKLTLKLDISTAINDPKQPFPKYLSPSENPMVHRAKKQIDLNFPRTEIMQISAIQIRKLAGCRDFQSKINFSAGSHSMFAHKTNLIRV